LTPSDGKFHPSNRSGAPANGVMPRSRSHWEIRGRVARVESDPDSTLANALAKKYLGLDVFPGPVAGCVTVVVEPEHISQMG
jgi:hypothetical protein